MMDREVCPPLRLLSAKLRQGLTVLEDLLLPLGTGDTWGVPPGVRSLSLLLSKE